jgi:phenylalanyl-tRNA synthetase beta chain
MPAHPFDIKKLPGKEFHTRVSRKGEKVTTLDGIEREMPEDIIIIENDNKVVDLCGVMGGENSGIGTDTSEVFFHNVVYEPVRIRKAMIALGHRTDAGTIFEKGIAPELAETGMDRLLELITKIFPDANIASKRFVKKQFKDEKRKIKVSHEKIENILGFKIKGTDVNKVLTGLGFSVNQTQKDYAVTVPFWRKNGIHIPEDIIEEIIRIYGYSNVDMKLPVGSYSPPVIHRPKIIAKKIREILAGQGFFEEQNYSFLGKSLLKKFEWKDDEKLLEIINPVSDDMKYMRPSQIPYLLQNAARNIRENDARRSYELQKIFYKKDGEVIEKTRLVGIVVEEEGALKAKGAIEDVLKSLNIDANFNEVDDLPNGHPGKSLIIESDGEAIGSIYELKPSISRNFELPEGIGVFEIKMERVGSKKSETRQYKKISKFPRVTLDVNVVVDRKVRAKNVEEWIRSAEKDLIENISLKDIYEGKNLGDDKKSLTYALTYQALDRTLEEKEIQDVLNRVIGSLEKNGGVVRR